jgi:hypothetical protein
MPKPLRLVVLTLGIGLSLATVPASSLGRCRITCSNTSNLSCTSEVGDCQFIIGDVHNFIVCDGVATVCP